MLQWRSCKKNSAISASEGLPEAAGVIAAFQAANDELKKKVEELERGT